MKKHDLAVFAVFDLMYLAISCLAASVIGFVVVWGLNLFYDTGFAVDAGVRAGVLGLVSVGLCAVFAYYDGYRYASFSWRGSLISAGIAAAVHYGLGLATRFAPILFGPTRHLSGLIAFGEHYNEARIASIPLGTLALVGAIMMLVYVGAFLLAGRLGCANRLRDRAETIGGATTSK